MIEDFRQLHDAEAVVADVCIIGAGAAGITLALSLAESNLRCCVLESGGMNFDPEIQSLGHVKQGESDDLNGCYLRYFGGATNHWAGWCAPLSTQDFETRPWIPHSGWPITRDELDSYYANAQSICGLGPLGYSLAELSDESHDFQLFNSAKITTNFYQFSAGPKHFGQAYEPALRNASNIRVLLYANVTHLEANKDATAVNAAKILTLDGKSGRVFSRYFIIACGGIQNARLLLLSNEIAKSGLGNDDGLVGRYFMQHPHVPCASLLTSESDTVNHLFSRYQKNGFTVRASLGPSAEQQRQDRILSCSATISNKPDPVSGYGALRHIWHDVKDGKWPDELGARLWTVISDLDSVTSASSWMTLFMRSEQSPNPDSRVLLSNTRDKLGLPEAKIEWQLTNMDKRTVYVASRLLGEELARLKVGRVKLPDWLMAKNDSWIPELWGGCHLMGTTRMSESPENGIVDRNCRMHSVDNVFIAGSSVFPTSGYVNPTLTIVALALRLADHIKTLPA